MQERGRGSRTTWSPTACALRSPFGRSITTPFVIPVIVVSARDIKANKERALKAGAKAFVQKPWNDSELLTLISEQLGQPNIVYLSTAKDPYPEVT